MNPFLPVLAFEKIGRAPAGSHLKKEWTSTQKLEIWLSFLAKRGYTFITPLDLKELPAKPVLLAFVGGYQSFYTEVFPLLQKYKACATLFVAVETLGTYNSWQDPYQEPWQNIVTLKQVQEMYQSGLVKIGTLGLNGHNLLEDEPDQARQNVEESIYRLKKLHKLGTCALAFWPCVTWNESHAQHLVHGLKLPIITPQKGRNLRGEISVLRILRPGLFTRFLLWKNR